MTNNRVLAMKTPKWKEAIQSSITHKEFLKAMEEPSELERYQFWRDFPQYQRHAYLLESMGLLKHSRVNEAFQSVDRGDFLRGENMFFSMADHPLPIGYEQTNSA